MTEQQRGDSGQHPGPAAPGARPGGDPGRDVRAPVGRVAALGLPAVHARRPRRADLGRRRERVRRPDVQLRAGGARPPASAGGAGGGGAGGPGRLPERPRPGHGGPRRAARADRGPRGLGDVRQERHRRHHHVLHDRPGADRAAEDPGRHGRLPRRRALVHAAARPASPRRTAPTSATTPTTISPACTRAAAEAGDDLAAILVSPFKHDAGYDQELVDPAFARGLRALCDATGAALILDDVRCGFRLHLGSSWEPIGVSPDLSAWSKAIANGHPLAAVLGDDAFRDGARQVFVTGSFWFSAVPMAAAIATITALGEERAVEAIQRSGTELRDGILAQARSWELPVNYTGPVAMPYLSFAGRRRPGAGRPVRGRRPARRRLPPSTAQLVRLRRPDRRRHRDDARGDGPGVRRRPQAAWPVRKVPIPIDP